MVNGRLTLRENSSVNLNEINPFEAFIDEARLSEFNDETNRNHYETKLIMTKKPANDYLLLFRGGANPEDMTPEQMKTTMNNWMTWMKGLRKRKQMGSGQPLQDGGKLLSGSKGGKVAALRDTPQSIGGYMLIKAKNLTEATKIAKGCPIFNNGGSVELRSIQQM